MTSRDREAAGARRHAGIVAVLVLVCVSVGGLPQIARAATAGTRLWGSSYGLDDSDSARAIDVSPDGSRVFVTGSITTGRGEYGAIGTVAYDGSSGSELWASPYDIPGRGGAGEDLVASPDGSAVFVTGYIGGANSYDVATLAYGAATGVELWVRRYDSPTNGMDSARAIDVSPDGAVVFVTGVSYTEPYPSGNARYVTVAYEASSGIKLWTRRYHGRGKDEEIGARASGASALSVSPDGSTVFVTGTSFEGSSTKRDYVTLAYDASTGVDVWIGRYDGPGNRRDNATAMEVSADGATIFVTGQSPSGTRRRLDFATVAYDATTGAERWVGRYAGPANSYDVPLALGVGPNRSAVYVTGASSDPSGLGYDYLTVAYDAMNGAELWIRRDGPRNIWGDGDRALALGVSDDGSQIFVTGQAKDAAGSPNAATFAYDAGTGGKIWARHPDRPTGAADLALGPDGTLFLTGVASRPHKGGEYFTLAYST